LTPYPERGAIIAEYDRDPQFHLPLNVPPEVSSETVMESAVRLGRHNGACLVASVPARRSFDCGTRFKHRDKADIQVELSGAAG